ncbi:MAG: hypothetical protein LUG93_15275 [Lachnospiraceae bacterium]|nr:hypothetical protein [Lachnospiraceae bacterium]
MREQIKIIRQRMSCMTAGERVSYIITYYWYHILGMAALLFLPVFLAVHVAGAMERTEFTCVLVNQAIDYERDDELGERLADWLGLKASLVEVDSDYNISYGDVQLDGVNESSYEKFFFKWNNKELDAVILPESFYEYCKELGGSFRDLQEFETGDLPLYEDSGTIVGVRIEETGLLNDLSNETGEVLLLVFPESADRMEYCQSFLDYIQEAS